MRVLCRAALLVIAAHAVGCGADDSPAPPDQTGGDAAADGKVDATDGALPDADAGAAGSGGETGTEADAASEGAVDSAADAVDIDATSDVTQSDALADAATDVADEGNAADAADDASAAADAETGADSAVEAGSTQDAAAETSDAPSLDSGTCQVPGPSKDVWRPTVVIKQATGQKDPTTSLPIVFTVEFSEPMDWGSLTADDFVVSPEPGTGKQLVDSGDHMTFELRITTAAKEGNYGVTLPAGRASDPAGNVNEASTGNDKVFFDSLSPTVEIRPTQAMNATNTLPHNYQVSFVHGINPATFDAADIVNEGTATGVVWQLQAQSPGYVYTLSATAVGGSGTLKPEIPAGAVSDANAIPNLGSVHVGDPVTYTTLPILSIADAKANEGDSLTFLVRSQGTVPTGVTFDWITVDGSAVAGVDFVQKGQTNVAFPANSAWVPLQVALTPDDDQPEPHKEFRVRLSNVKGAVYLARDQAQVTVVNDDRGYSSFSANGSSADASAQEIVIHGNTVNTFGTTPTSGASLVRRNATTDEIEQHLTVGSKAAGLAQNESGYYFAVDDGLGGFKLMKFTHTEQTFDVAFGTYGEIERVDAQNAYVSADVVADDSAVYVMGSRGSEPVWYIERRDATTGALSSAFGASGVLSVDHVSGATQEGVLKGASDGASLVLLGNAGTQWMVEKRTAVDGALDMAFAEDGVLRLDCLTRGDEVAIHDGALYVLGDGATGVVLSRFDLASGALLWQRSSPMDQAGALAVGESGVFVGGVRDAAWHLERWAHDGTPIWAQTHLRDKDPAGARALALHGTIWLYAAGYHSWNQYHDWYYERRSITEGLTWLYEPGNPAQ